MRPILLFERRRKAKSLQTPLEGSAPDILGAAGDQEEFCAEGMAGHCREYGPKPRFRHAFAGCPQASAARASTVNGAPRN